MDVVILEQFEHKIINYVIGSYHVLGYFYALNKLLVGEIQYHWIITVSVSLGCL